MGAASYVDALFSALENQRNVTLKSQTIEKGSIKDAELVLLRLFRDKEYKESSRVKSFKVEVGESYEGHLTPLTSLWMLAFIVHQREFDGFWAAAKIEQIMKQNVQALHEREATLANLQVSSKNKGVDNLSEDEKKKLRKAKDAVQEARDLIDEHLDTVYDAYERMMDVRKHKFTNLVRSECLTAKDHVVNKVVLIKEAFRADSTTGAAVPVDRLPDKDNEDQPDDPATAGFRIVWRWERRDETVHGMPGKTLELFKEIRKSHMKNELDGKFGQAEAQFVYMMNNIKLPQGCSVDALDTMIEQISTLMYLLPSIHDDPNPAYQNGALSHRQRRDQPFAEGEMTEMLFNAMPYALQKLWKLDNGNQLIPTDRQLLKQELKILMEKKRISWRRNVKISPKGRGEEKMERNARLVIGSLVILRVLLMLRGVVVQVRGIASFARRMGNVRRLIKGILRPSVRSTLTSREKSILIGNLRRSSDRTTLINSMRVKLPCPRRRRGVRSQRKRGRRKARASVRSTRELEELPSLAAAVILPRQAALAAPPTAPEARGLIPLQKLACHPKKVLLKVRRKVRRN